MRDTGLAPLIQICDALSWNTSHLAHCMSRGRHQFVEVAENFPGEWGYMLETLGGIWHHDALAREQKLSSRSACLRFHQEHSGQVPNLKAFFDRIHRLTLEGMFGDPCYGGNRNFAGWDLIRYPGSKLASSPQDQ